VTVGTSGPSIRIGKIIIKIAFNTIIPVPSRRHLDLSGGLTVRSKIPHAVQTNALTDFGRGQGRGNRGIDSAKRYAWQGGNQEGKTNIPKSHVFR
jgi:hypothetical protein